MAITTVHCCDSYREPCDQSCRCWKEGATASIGWTQKKSCIGQHPRAPCWIVGVPKERVLDREIKSTIKKGHKALGHTQPQRSSTCLERAVVTQRQPRSKLNFPGGLPIDTDCTTNKSSREKRHQGLQNKWNDWHMVLRWGTRTKWPIGATKLMYDEDSLEPRPVSSNWQHLVSKEAADEQIYNKRRTAESTMWN